MDKKRRRILTVAWTAGAAILALAVLTFTFRGLDTEGFLHVLAKAEWVWISVLILVMPTEQGVRGWKWRQILFDIRPVPTLRLFSAVMAGYFANMVVPVGISPLVRAWLVARKEALKISTVLLTTAIERFVDGVVFTILTGVLVSVYTLPEISGNLRMGLITAGGGGFLLFASLFALLIYAKPKLHQQDSGFGRLLYKLEIRFSRHLSGLARGIAQGIAWPASHFRGIGIIGASFLMKVISATHFLWAGWAFGITLGFFDYLFVMVFSGFSMILTRFVRIPGGGVIGSAIALRLLGLPDEEVLAMVAIVHAASVATTVFFGAPTLWYSGIKISSLNPTGGHPATWI